MEMILQDFFAHRQELVVGPVNLLDDHVADGVEQELPRPHDGTASRIFWGEIGEVGNLKPYQWRVAKSIDEMVFTCETALKGGTKKWSSRFLKMFWKVG